MTTPGGQLTPGDDTTPPVYGVPDGAYVGDAGSPNAISQLSHMTETSAKEAMKTPVAPSFAAQRDGVWGLMDRVAEAITGQTPEGDPLEYVEDWMNAERENTGQVLDSYGEALAEKVSADAVPTIAPLSQAINRRADPTFQLSDFMAPKMYGTDSRGDTVTVTPSVLSLGASTAGMVYFAFITPLINRAYEQLNFMVSAVTSTPRQMDVGVYVLDAETKELRRQVYAPNVGAGLPFTESVVKVDFPRWVAEQGSYVAIAWYQSGAGEERYLLGLEEAARPLTDAVFPPKISARSGVGTGGLDSSIDGTDQTRVGFGGYWFTPYAELSEAISVVLRFFQDPFTVDSSQYIARPWVGLTSAEIRVHRDGWAGVPLKLFASTGTRAAIYESPLSTDRVQVTARALAGYGVGPNAESFLAVRTTNDMATGVGVFYSLDTIQIRSWMGGAENIHTMSMVQASTSWSLVDSREFTVTWENGEIAVYDESNLAILSWTDTITQPGARYRFVGIGFRRSGGYDSPRLDHWAARDLPAIEEEDPVEP